MQTKIISCGASFKASGKDNSGEFEGYGSVFGNIDSWGDIVEKGAFVKSLNEYGMPALLLHHDSRQVGGIYTQAYEDSKGLFLRGELNLEVQAAREAYALLKQGAIKGMSIGYRPLVEEYDRENEVNRLKEVELLEVSLVTFPANRQANVTGVKNTPKTERELEVLLRDAGYGRTQAKAIVSRGFKGLEDLQRDADENTAEQGKLAEIQKMLAEMINQK